MNERVWLQSGNQFVNTIARGAAVFCIAALAACGERAEEPVESVETAPTPVERPTLPAIWETSIGSGEFLDLAFVSSGGGRLYIAGLTADGDLSIYDLDGAPIAQSRDSLDVSKIAAGAPLLGPSTAIAPGLSENGDLYALVIDLSVGGVGEILVDAGGGYTAICAGDMSDDVLPMALGRSDEVLVGALRIDGDMATFERQASYDLDGVVTTCAWNGDQGLAAAGDRVFRIADGAVEIALKAPTSPLSLELGMAEAASVAVWTDEEGDILVADIADEAQQPKRFGVAPGMSVGAPDPVAVIAIQSGRFGPDYEAGVVAATGLYADGAPRITYVDLASLVDAPE